MTTPPRGTRTAVYLRISDDREGEAQGVERQRQDCLARVEREGWSLVGEPYCDNDIGASTRSANKPRPAFDRMVAAVKRGEVDVVLSYSTSRLRRRPLENESLIRLHETTGVVFRTIVSGDDDLSTADGRQMARIRASIDAGEAERISERVSRKKLENAREGKFSGGRRPFGFEPDGVTIRESEAEEIRVGTRKILQSQSLRSVAKYYNDKGVLTATGRQWTPTAVKDMLVRPRNSGLVKYAPVTRDEDGNRIVNRSAEAFGPASWEAIVSNDQRLAVLAILKDPKRNTNPGRPPKYLGPSVYLCGVCGSKMRAVNSGSRATRYVCNGNRGAGPSHISRNADQTDAHVSAEVVRWLVHHIGHNKLTGAETPAVEVDEDWQTLTSELAAIEELRSEMQDDRAAGYYTQAKFREGMDQLREREESVRAKMEKGPATGKLLFPSVETPADVAPMWEAMTVEQKRAVISGVMTVTILPVNKRTSTFRPESVSVEARVSPYFNPLDPTASTEQPYLED